MSRTPTLIALGVAGSLVLAGCAADGDDPPQGSATSSATMSTTTATNSTGSSPAPPTTVTPSATTSPSPTKAPTPTPSAPAPQTSTAERSSSPSTTKRPTGTAHASTPAPTRAYSCTDPETGTTRACTRTEWRELQRRIERAKGPTLTQCRTPDTHEQYLQCVDKYSRSQTGDDPALPPNAVSPQLCWAWQNGDVDLTPAEQQYCRDNEL